MFVYIKVTSHEYVLDMYDAEFCGEYDEVVTTDYGKCDHLKVPSWILDVCRAECSSSSDEGGSPLRVLDLGCGTGISSQVFLDSEDPKCRVVGMDLTPAMCSEARRSREFEEVICGAIDEPLPFPEARFDAVVMLGVLEFIKEPAEVAKEARRVLRAGGLFGLSVPQQVNITVELELGVQTFAPGEVEAGIEKAGFEVVKQEALHGYTLDYPERKETFTINYASSVWRAV